MSGYAFDPCAKCEEVMQPYLDRDLNEEQMLEAEAHHPVARPARRIANLGHCSRDSHTLSTAHLRFPSGLQRLIREQFVNL